MNQRLPPRFEDREISPRSPLAAAIFWIVQIFLGGPSIFLTLNLLATGKAEGALFTICLFLAWIAATLSVGVATLIHGSRFIQFPLIFPVEVPKSEPDPESQIYKGYPYRLRRDGKIDVQTAGGVVTYEKWADFTAAVG